MRDINKYLRVARTRAQKLNASTLYTAGVSCRSLGIGGVAVFFGNFTIITRVAVYQDANSTKLLRTLNFEASEDSSISGNGNLSLEVDTGGNQIRVILICSVVDIDKRTSNVSAGRVAVKGWDPVLGRRGGIVFKSILGQRCLERDIPGFGVARLLQQRDAVIGGVVDVDIIGDDAGLDAPFLPPLFSPLSLEVQALVFHVFHVLYIAIICGKE